MSDENTRPFPISTVILPIICTIGINVVTVMALHKSHVEWFIWILYYLTGIVGGIIAASIGNLLRNYAMPDVTYVSGGFMNQLSNKLFWAIGPQFVASLIVPLCWFFFAFLKSAK